MTTEALPRLLCVVQLPPPLHGASSVNQAVTRSATLGTRFDVSVLPLRFASSIEDIGRFSVRKLARALLTGAELAQVLLEQRPDAVYFTLSPHGGAFYRDLFYVTIMKAFRVRRIFHLHGKGVAGQLSKRWRRALYASAFRNAWVILLSPLLAEDVRGVVASDRIMFVANGIPDRVAPLPASSPRQGPPRVLFLSHMFRTKGPLLLLEALLLLKQTGVAFEATFAGASARDGCLAEFAATIERLDLADCTHYIGPVYGDDKDRLLAEHDIFALPTFEDAFPLVLLEAMQWGLPIVTTAEGAIADIVADGETGFVVPRNDANSLARQLETLLVDHALRRTMGDRGRARFLEHFTLQKFEHRLVEALVRSMDH